MASENLQVELRETQRKGAARALRRKGFVPAVVYGDNKQVQKISLEQRVVDKQLATGRMLLTIYELNFGEASKQGEQKTIGAGEQVLVRDIQFDPVRDVVTHIDFQRITARSQLRIDVPVTFLNQDVCVGLKRGGILNVVRHEITLLCRAQSIPDIITVDLAKADIGDSIHASQAQLSEGVELAIKDRDFTIATIVAPKVAAADEEVEEAEEETSEEKEEEEKKEE